MINTIHKAQSTPSPAHAPGHYESVNQSSPNRPPKGVPSDVANEYNPSGDWGHAQNAPPPRPSGDLVYTGGSNAKHSAAWYVADAVVGAPGRFLSDAYYYANSFFPPTNYGVNWSAYYQAGRDEL